MNVIDHPITSAHIPSPTAQQIGCSNLELEEHFY